eukprot:1091843-Amphidinium_carterae.1
MQQGTGSQGSNADSSGNEYQFWLLNENLKIHGHNAARLTKQVKELQAELAAVQLESAQLRATNLQLKTEVDQMTATNYYYLQNVQSNAEYLAKISQLEREREFTAFQHPSADFGP